VCVTRREIGGDGRLSATTLGIENHDFLHRIYGLDWLLEFQENTWGLS
jgi:hypothetical protein